jgi:tetraacyldisaccharide 4'-kinase
MNRILQVVLFPVSLCYGLAMQVRNLLFDLHILPSRSFNVPVISVGNLTMGGTGKTPVTEYLIRLLVPQYNVATLSRGYRRKTHGFVLAHSGSDAAAIGDEPLQIHRKFYGVSVAVDEKRSRGIQFLLKERPSTGIILLDDAYQHRYVRPGKSILLTDYHKLYTDDHVLPSGTLREFRNGARRADIIVVTKTPKIFSPITRRRILEELRPRASQLVFFSFIRYGELFPVFTDPAPVYPSKVINILLFTGIANDYPLREHLERMCSELVVIKYADHHRFTKSDIESILKKFNDLPTQKKILVTSEKDMMRLKTPQLSPYFKNLPLFCVPMEIDFHGTDKQQFDNEILKYADKYKRDH